MSKSKLKAIWLSTKSFIQPLIFAFLLITVAGQKAKIIMQNKTLQIYQQRLKEKSDSLNTLIAKYEHNEDAYLKLKQMQQINENLLTTMLYNESKLKTCKDSLEYYKNNTTYLLGIIDKYHKILNKLSTDLKKLPERKHK